MSILRSLFNGLTGSWQLIEELPSSNLINIFQGFHLTTTTVSREKVLVQLWLSLTSSRGPPILLALQPTQAAVELHQVSIQSHILAKLLLVVVSYWITNQLTLATKGITLHNRLGQNMIYLFVYHLIGQFGLCKDMDSLIFVIGGVQTSSKSIKNAY